MADKETYRLTEADVEILRGLVRADRQGTRTTRNRTGPLDGDAQDQQAPEVYLVYTGADGIPALDEVTTGTEYADDVPGYASCAPFTFDPVDNTAYRLSNLFIDVYNFSTRAVPGDSWVVVAREKGGVWVPVRYDDLTSCVALTPLGGIAALSEGADTGTAFGYGDVAPSAVCAVYRGQPLGYLVPTGEHITVYNLLPVGIGPNRWLTPVRDRYGTWWVPSQGLRFAGCDGSTTTGTA